MAIYSPLPRELPPARGSYTPEYFVGRKEELRSLTRKIEDAQAGSSITRPVVHIWGAPGIGKSWLLRHICQQASEIASQTSELQKREGALCALIDFSELRFAAQEPLTRAELLQHLYQQLQSKIKTFQKSHRKHEVTTPLAFFIEYLSELSKQHVTLLLFDSIENLSPDDFFWLEQHLLEPLARTDRIILVISGRQEIPRWKEFSVRRRLERWEIRPFEASTTREQLSSLGVQGKWAPDVYAHTFGHPYANQVWGTALADGEPEAVFASQSNLLLGQIEGELLRGVFSETERDILRTLSTLRKFNIESARTLLTEILSPEKRELGENYGAMSDGDYLRLIERLERTNLVYWHSERRAYVMDPSVRRIIDLRIQQGSPRVFRERHAVAQRLYEAWFRESSKDRGALLLEILYHLSRRMAEASTPDINREVRWIWEEYLTTDLGTDNVDMLWRQIKADRDFQGYGSVMPAEALDEFQTRVEQLRDNMITMPLGEEL